MIFLIYLGKVLLLGTMIVLLSNCLLSRGLGDYRYTHEEKGNVEYRVINIWIDKNFNEYDKGKIEYAISSWNYVLNGFIRLRVVDRQFGMEPDKILESVHRNGWLIMQIDSRSKLIPVNEKGYWTIGFVNRVGGSHLYLINDRINMRSIYGLTLHEIGHLLGAGHVGEGLMYPRFEEARFRCIDRETIRAVARYWHVSDSIFNYCY